MTVSPFIPLILLFSARLRVAARQSNGHRQHRGPVEAPHHLHKTSSHSKGLPWRSRPHSERLALLLQGDRSYLYDESSLLHAASSDQCQTWRGPGHRGDGSCLLDPSGGKSSVFKKRKQWNSLICYHTNLSLVLENLHSFCNAATKMPVWPFPRVHTRARGDCHTTEADMKRCPADLIKKKEEKLVNGKKLALCLKPFPV